VFCLVEKMLNSTHNGGVLGGGYVPRRSGGMVCGRGGVEGRI